MIRTLIIEDETNAQELLSSIIAEYCPELILLGTASNIDEGYALIESQKPDLVFLDIQLGEDRGFDILDRLMHRDFKLVITTAYDQYAMEGFKYEAVDYILKPYSPTSIVSAVQRVKRYKGDEYVFSRLSNMIKSDSAESYHKKLQVSTTEGIHILDYDDIIKVEANKAYCQIHRADGTKLLVSKSIGSLEKKLPPQFFFRVHSGHIVHLRYVKQICNQDGGYIVMTDDSQVPIARRRKQEFMLAIQG